MITKKNFEAKVQSTRKPWTDPILWGVKKVRKEVDDFNNMFPEI